VIVLFSKIIKEQSENSLHETNGSQNNINLLKVHKNEMKEKLFLRSRVYAVGIRGTEFYIYASKRSANKFIDRCFTTRISKLFCRFHFL
jgi:hypothetical protein